jgi:hypothetical protein
MRAERRRSEPREVIVNRGTLEWGSATVEYYTTQPAPAQWTAIAVVPLCEAEGTSRMLVGSGPSEDAAVTALIQRLARTSIILEPSHEPSNWFGG